MNSIWSDHFWHQNVMCTGVRVKNNNGSRPDDWIHWPFFVQSLLITSHRTLSLIYTRSSSPLHTHWDSHSPLVVAWWRISTQELSLQITMKSSCNFFFSHLEMPTQFSNSNSPVFVLHGTNLYLTNLRNIFPLVSTIRFLVMELKHPHCK
jgi:hypothetical protein